MSDPFVLRAAARSDYVGLRALLVDVDELHRVNVPWMFRRPIAEPRPDEFFEKQLASDDSTLLVAEAGERLIGVAAALMRDAPDFALFVTQRWGILDNIAVSQTWRRRGGLAPDREVMQVRVVPTHGDLDRPVQVVRRELRRHDDPSPDGRVDAL